MSHLQAGVMVVDVTVVAVVVVVAFLFGRFRA